MRTEIWGGVGVGGWVGMQLATHCYDLSLLLKGNKYLEMKYFTN